MSDSIEKSIPATTIVDAFYRRVKESPQTPAFFTLTEHQQWQATNWQEISNQVESLAELLANLHIQDGERIGICAPTSMEWEVSQLAAFRIGKPVVGLDPYYSDQLLNNFIEQLNISVLVVQNDEVLTRFSESLVSRLKVILMIEPTEKSSEKILSLKSFFLKNNEISCSLPMPSLNTEALVIFSSGTTGTPKPIFYLHDQLSVAVHAILEAFTDIKPGSILICWLPLSNLFQRMINFSAMVRGAITYFIQDPRTVMDHIKTVNPHVFIGVPRFFEKLNEGMVNHIKTQSRLSRFIATRAIEVGKRYNENLRENMSPSITLNIAWNIADRIVLKKIRSTFGSNLNYFISGSSPMPLWLLEWFDAIGLPVLEAYGVSENIAPIALNRYHKRKLGTVGKPLPIHNVKLASDGEILVLGRGVASPHNQTKDSELHTKIIDGLLATGDIGSIDKDGFLKITGRKNDIFKISNGKWIAPSEIEARLCRLSYIEYAVVLGANKKMIIALVGVTKQCLVELPQIEARFAEDIHSALLELPDYQKPAGLLIIGADSFSINSGELTTNLKIRRKYIADKFMVEIENFYRSLEEKTYSFSKLPFMIIDRGTK